MSRLTWKWPQYLRTKPVSRKPLSREKQMWLWLLSKNMKQKYMSLFLPIIKLLHLCPLFSIICAHRWESIFTQTTLQHRGRERKNCLCMCYGINPFPWHPFSFLSLFAVTYPEHGVVESDSLMGGDLTGLSCCASNIRYKDCFFGVLSSCWQQERKDLLSNSTILH